MKPDCPYLHTVPKPKAMASRGKEAFIAIYITVPPCIWKFMLRKFVL